MPFITFFYRINNNSKTYYGKKDMSYISDDHSGLDEQVKYDLINGLNDYRKQKGLPKLEEEEFQVGVLSFSDSKYIPTFSTNDEIKCFDFYCEDSNVNYKKNIYVNGKLIN